MAKNFNQYLHTCTFSLELREGNIQAAVYSPKMKKVGFRQVMNEDGVPEVDLYACSFASTRHLFQQVIWEDLLPCYEEKKKRKISIVEKMWAARFLIRQTN